MTYPPNTFWVVADSSGRILHHVLRPTLEEAQRALYGRADPQSGARDGAGAEVERQRRDRWHIERVKVTRDSCSLCGEPWTEDHECRRDE